MQLKQEPIYLNSVVVERRAVEVGETPGARELVEALGGRSYHILKDAGFPWRDDTAEIAVPPDQYYVLGDNRDNAVDRRADRSRRTRHPYRPGATHLLVAAVEPDRQSRRIASVSAGR